MRGAFVVLTLFGGVGLFLYGVGWLFLPHPDGRIHAQEVLRGVVTAGFVGGALCVVADAGERVGQRLVGPAPVRRRPLPGRVIVVSSIWWFAGGRRRRRRRRRSRRVARRVAGSRRVGRAGRLRVPDALEPRRHLDAAAPAPSRAVRPALPEGAVPLPPRTLPRRRPLGAADLARHPGLTRQLP